MRGGGTDPQGALPAHYQAMVRSFLVILNAENISTRRKI